MPKAYIELIRNWKRKETKEEDVEVEMKSETNKKKGSKNLNIYRAWVLITYKHKLSIHNSIIHDNATIIFNPACSKLFVLTVTQETYDNVIIQTAAGIIISSYES